MAVALAGMMLAGSAISAYGAIQQGQAQKAAAEYNARLSERNALVSTQQSTAQADQIRREAARVQGAAVARFGASGLTLEGSALDALADSAANAQLDQEMVKYRGQLKAMGYHDTATLDRMAGETAQQQSYYRAASEVLTGVGRAGATYAAGTRRIGDSNALLYQ